MLTVLENQQNLPDTAALLLGAAAAVSVFDVVAYFDALDTGHDVGTFEDVVGSVALMSGILLSSSWLAEQTVPPNLEARRRVHTD